MVQGCVDWDAMRLSKLQDSGQVHTHTPRVGWVCRKPADGTNLILHQHVSSWKPPRRWPTKRQPPNLQLQTAEAQSTRLQKLSNCSAAATVCYGQGPRDKKHHPTSQKPCLVWADFLILFPHHTELPSLSYGKYKRYYIKLNGNRSSATFATQLVTD